MNEFYSFQPSTASNPKQHGTQKNGTGKAEHEETATEVGGPLKAADLLGKRTVKQLRNAARSEEPNEVTHPPTFPEPT